MIENFSYDFAEFCRCTPVGNPALLLNVEQCLLVRCTSRRNHLLKRCEDGSFASTGSRRSWTLRPDQEL